MKRGFTLIELLAVIVILAVTSMIIFPNIIKVVNDNKEDLYNSQIMEIEKAAEKWSLDNVDRLDETHSNDIFISLESLKLSKYIEMDEVKNPKDKTIMNGCVRIRYNLENKKYTYIYEEKTCELYSEDTLSGEEFGTIIYTYSKDNKTFVKNSDNEVKSVGVAIYSAYQNSIKTIGQTEDGLYDIDDEYVFKGINPNNYVSLNGKEGNTTRTTSWRILSINKKTNTVKLISATPIATNAWDSFEKITFKDSSLNGLLLSKVSENGVAYYTSKIINNDYSIGVIPSSEFSTDALKSVLNDTNAVDNKSSQKVGTLSVLDYVNASASNCYSNYLSNSCATNNYLKNMFGDTNTTWTLNTNGEAVWSINSDGSLQVMAPTINKQIYAVVTLDSSSYISNFDTATGTSTNPYIIK